MIEIICNDRLGKKVKVKCLPDDTIGDFKRILAAQIGTPADKLGYTTYRDHISLADYEIHNGMNLELDGIDEIRLEWTIDSGGQAGR